MGTPAAPTLGWRRLAAGREDMQLVSVAVNGEPLSAGQYDRQPKSLTISPEALPEGEFEVTLVTELKPQVRWFSWRG